MNPYFMMISAAVVPPACSGIFRKLRSALHTCLRLPHTSMIKMMKKMALCYAFIRIDAD